MLAIEVDKVSKSYGGRRGIGDVSFAVPEGTLFGFAAAIAVYRRQDIHA